MLPILVMWIHLVAAIAWIGGMLFSLFVLKPVLKRIDAPFQGNQLLTRLEGRFRIVRWTSLIALLVTGFFSLLHEGGSARLESSWGAVLMVKLLFVAIVVGLTGINDFMLNPGTDAIKKESWLSDFILVLGLFIVFIAVYLRL
ncbi:MAG: DUF4149 domain-containing protein [Nitrospiria bacterium]